MGARYWDEEGKYQEQYTTLFETLVPGQGNADTVAGELIRAASRLYYDCYNNGMGNNTSGAVNYLLEQGVIDKGMHGKIHYWTTGRVLPYDSPDFNQLMDDMVDVVMEHILANPELKSQSNTDDIFDFSDDDIELCDGCGEVMEGYGYLCYSCEEQEEYDAEEEEEWC